MKLIPFSDFIRLESIPRCQDLKCGIDVSKIKGQVPVLAICHRWFTPEHPDPNNVIIKKVFSIPGLQKELATEFRGQDFYVFYDYACLNQRPRTGREERQFSKDLLEMDKVFGDEHKKMKTKVFPLDAPDLRERSWCVFETCLGHLHENLVVVLDSVCEQFWDCFQIISALKELLDGIHHPLKLITVEPKVLITTEWIVSAIKSSKATNGDDVTAIAGLFRRHFMRYAAAKYAFQLHYVCLWNGRGELDLSLLQQEILRAWERKEIFATPDVKNEIAKVRFRFQGKRKVIQSEMVPVRDGKLCLEKFIPAEFLPKIEIGRRWTVTSDRRFETLMKQIRRHQSPSDASP